MPVYTATFEIQPLSEQFSLQFIANNIVEARDMTDNYAKTSKCTVFEVSQAANGTDAAGEIFNWQSFKDNLSCMSESEIREWLMRFRARAFLEGVEITRRLTKAG